MTTGIGTTGAGLTVSCYREQNEFVLEAGALVLADSGVWCIDEFNKVKKEDRASLHESMEQQSISVAKGGIVCKINTRATIVAACNQIQGKEHLEDLSASTGIISSLLSRFDMIFMMIDDHDIEEDSAKADYWLYRYSKYFKEDEDIWPVEKMNKYVMFVQSVLNPWLTESAEIIFKAYYLYIKSNRRVGKDRKTVRFLESMIRLSQAHARLMFREEINTLDAITVIMLMEHTLSSGLIKENYVHTRYESRSTSLFIWI